MKKRHTIKIVKNYGIGGKEITLTGLAKLNYDLKGEELGEDALERYYRDLDRVHYHENPLYFSVNFVKAINAVVFGRDYIARMEIIK